MHDNIERDGTLLRSNIQIHINDIDRLPWLRAELIDYWPTMLDCRFKLNTLYPLQRFADLSKACATPTPTVDATATVASCALSSSAANTEACTSGNYEISGY